MKKQKYTSARTSINAGKLPRVFRQITPAAGAVLYDYGCGRYTDHIRDAFPGVEYLPFDPYNKPAAVNKASRRALRSAIAAGRPVVVTCSNVLNVIDSDAVIRGIASDLCRYVHASRGVAYVTVYTGDRSGRGRQTGPDQYQRNEPLRDYLRFFDDMPGVSATIRKNTIVIKGGF